MLVTLIVITMASYLMMRVAPGDPRRAALVGGAELQGELSAERAEGLADPLMFRRYHLDRHPAIGYYYWLKGVVTRFDFGESLVFDRGTPVLRIIRERLPTTIKLNLWAIAISYAVAVPIGVYSAVRHRSLTERFTGSVLFFLYSLPTFWVGLLLLMFFASDQFLNIFPVTGLSPAPSQMWGASYWQILGMTAKHYVLPVVCLTYGGLAGLSRYARVGLLEVIRQDYVRTARAKGLPWHRVVLIHALRNGMIPLITLFAGLLPSLVAGSVIVEYIFTIDGMGRLAVAALSSRDYPLMMAIFFMGSFLTLLGILISDLAYALVDPRIQY